MSRPSNNRIKAPRMRLSLAQLAVCFVFFVGASRALANVEIICSPNPGNQVTCSIIGDSYFSGDDLPIGENNGKLYCTNCVDMLPSVCQELKGKILQSIQSNYNAFGSIQSEAWTIRESCYQWVTHLTNMPQIIKASISTVGAVNKTAYDQYYDQLESSLWSMYPWQVPYPSRQYAYTATGAYNHMSGTRACEANYGYMVGVTSLGASVSPGMQTAVTESEKIATRAGQSQELLRSLESNVSSFMTCNQCDLGEGSKGGGGVEGGTGAMYNKYLEEIINYLKKIEEDTDYLQKFIENNEEQFREFREKVISNFAYLTNFTSRLDDYLFPDFTNSVTVIQSNVVYIAQNLARDNFIQQAFSNATYNSTSEGEDGDIINEDKIKRIFNSDKTDEETGLNFDMAEYFGIENWFSRVELLLLNIAGLTSTSNATAISKEEEKEFEEQFDETGKNFGDVSNRTYSVQQSIEKFKERYDEFLNTFNPLTRAVRPQYQIEFFPHVSFQGTAAGSLISEIQPVILDLEYGTTHKVSQVVEFARSVLSIIWWLISFVSEAAFFIYISKLVLTVVSFTMMYMRDFFR